MYSHSHCVNPYSFKLQLTNELATEDEISESDVSKFGMHTDFQNGGVPSEAIRGFDIENRFRGCGWQKWALM